MSEDNGTALAAFENNQVTYQPFGERSEITLKVGQVRNFIAAKTKSGKEPSHGELIKFLMLCKARELNPWVGDAYLCGYDSKEGPQFSLITAHQALLKRAEACKSFAGLESGIIIERDGEPVELVGSFKRRTDVIVGGWSAVYRSDRAVPQRSTVPLDVYNTNRSRWSKDPGGMIQKVAEAASLRKTFPSQIGGMYCGEEMDHVTSPSNGAALSASGGKVARSALNDQLEEPASDVIEGEIVTHETVSGSPATLDEPPEGFDLGDQSDELFDKSPNAAEA